MATRFYLPSSGTAPLGSLAVSSTWGVSTGLVRRPTDTTKSNTSLTNTSQTWASASTNDWVWYQFQSKCLATGYSWTTSDNVSMVLGKCYEGENQTDTHLAYCIRVVSADGGTVRGTIGVYQSTSLEFPLSASAATRIHNRTAGASNFSSQAGDRIIIEIGIYGVTPSLTGVTMRVGDPSATADFALTEALTTDLCSWVELSRTVSFDLRSSKTAYMKGQVVDFRGAPTPASAYLDGVAPSTFIRDPNPHYAYTLGIGYTNNETPGYKALGYLGGSENTNNETPGYSKDVYVRGSIDTNNETPGYKSNGYTKGQIENYRGDPTPAAAYVHGNDYYLGDKDAYLEGIGYEKHNQIVYLVGDDLALDQRDAYIYGDAVEFTQKVAYTEGISELQVDSISGYVEGQAHDLSAQPAYLMGCVGEVIHITHESGDLSEYTTPSAIGQASSATPLIDNYSHTSPFQFKGYAGAQSVKDITISTNTLSWRFWFRISEDFQGEPSSGYWLAHVMGYKGWHQSYLEIHIWISSDGRSCLFLAPLGDSSTDYQIATAYYDDLVWLTTPHLVEVISRRESYDGANDGYAAFYLDGSLIGTKTNIDDYIVWGTIDEYTTDDYVQRHVAGQIYVDDIIIRDDGQLIGGKKTLWGKVPGYIKGQVIDFRGSCLAFATGVDHATTQQVAYATGSIQDLSSKPTYLAGQELDLSEQIAYISGEDIGITHKDAYIEGIPGLPVSSASAYLKGLSDTLSQIPCYIHGSSEAADNTSLYLYGQASSIGSLSAYISGGVVVYTDKDAYLAGGVILYSSVQVNLTGGISCAGNAPAYIPVDAVATSSKAAFLSSLQSYTSSVYIYLSGIDSTLSSKPVYLAGGILSTDSTLAYLCGSTNTTGQKSGYIAGSDSYSSSNIVYLAGADHTLAQQFAYIVGSAIIISSKIAYLQGGEILSDYAPSYTAGSSSYIESKSVYLQGGEGGVTSSVTIYLRGQDTAYDNLQGYLRGSDNVPGLVHGYLCGASGQSSGVVGFTRGSLGISHSREAYIQGTWNRSSKYAFTRGSAATQAVSNAYLSGISGSQDSKPAYVKGESTSSSSKNCFCVGSLYEIDQSNAYLSGDASTVTQQAVFLRGTSTTLSYTPAYTSGKLGSVSQVPAYLEGTGTVTSSTKAYTHGSLDSASSTAGYLDAIGQVTSSTPAYIWCASPGTSKRSCYLEGTIRTYMHAYMRGIEIPGLTYLWISIVEDTIIWDTMSGESVAIEDDLAESDMIGDIQNG